MSTVEVKQRQLDPPTCGLERGVFNPVLDLKSLAQGKPVKVVCAKGGVSIVEQGNYDNEIVVVHHRCDKCRVFEFLG